MQRPADWLRESNFKFLHNFFCVALFFFIVVIPAGVPEPLFVMRQWHILKKKSEKRELKQRAKRSRTSSVHKMIPKKIYAWNNNKKTTDRRPIFSFKFIANILPSKRS